MKEARKYYDMLLEKGELQEVCPKAIGEWDEDKKIFLNYYEEMNDLVDNFEKDLEEGFDAPGVDEFNY